jgi:hypothetical protein
MADAERVGVTVGAATRFVETGAGGLDGIGGVAELSELEEAEPERADNAFFGSGREISPFLASTRK